LVGVFHSHPDHPDLPSEFDREWAQPQFSYLITRVEGGTAKGSRAWRLAEDRTKFTRKGSDSQPSPDNRRGDNHVTVLRPTRTQPGDLPGERSQMGQMLLQHLSKSNARKFGVDLLADAVLDGQHSLVLIAESEDLQYLMDFMQPFAQTDPLRSRPPPAAKQWWIARAAILCRPAISQQATIRLESIGQGIEEART